MHAAEILGALQRFGEVGDRDRRCIGGQDRVVANLRFGLGEDSVFDLRVLDNSLDDDIDIVETVIAQRRLDLVENARHVGDRDLLALDLLGQQFAGLLEAEVEPGLRDVLHDDRRAFGRGLVGNAAAHDARAEHRGAFHLAAFLREGLAALAENLVTDEQADQILCGQRAGHLRDAPSFFL